MNEKLARIAKSCLDGAETGTMTFPQIVGKLAAEGFEGYAIDYRRATATYFLPDGGNIELPAHRTGAVAAIFDPDGLKAAIREAQQAAPGYTYKGFCSKAAAAGCASYYVSFLGRRVLYAGRTAETHTEHFPS